MTEHKELNRKLAEWAGFAEIPWYVRAGKQIFEWLSPNAERHNETPDFVKSLDACFKWLVPKLDINDKVLVRWSPVRGYREYTAEIWIWGFPGKDFVVEWTTETPSLALSKAFEAVIDKECKCQS